MTSPLHATLTEGSVAGHLRTMAAPMVWGLLATMSFNAVDTFFVAQLGGDPLAAMAFTFPVIMVISSIAIGLGAGASSAVARAVGSGNSYRVKRLVTDAVCLAGLISVGLSALGLLTIDPLFTALGATPELLPLIHDYMATWYLSAPFLVVPMIALSTLRALGYSQIQGSLMVAAAVLNAALAPLLIFGLWGFPRLEIQGAALASLIVRVLTLIVVFVILQRRFQVLINPLASWTLLRRSWAALFHVGLPAIASNLIIPVASAIVVKLVAAYGSTAVAALGVAARIEPIALIAFYAVSGVVGPLAGQNKGAGQYDRVFETLRVIIIFSLTLGVVLALVLRWGGVYVAQAFSDSPAVLEVVALYMSIVPLSYGAYGLVMAVNAMFNGMGFPVPGLAISFLRVIGVHLPLAFLGMWLWDLPGLLLATALSNGVVALIGVLWLLKVLHAQRAFLADETRAAESAKLAFQKR